MSEGTVPEPLPPTKERFIDSGWRLTIPKVFRDRLGWGKGTPICVAWDGLALVVSSPTSCPRCPDLARMGALGKIVIPPRIREEASLYRGQIMSLSVEGNQIRIRPGRSQVRCQACGSEMDVREALLNVHLCRRCREALENAAAREAAGWERPPT